MDIQTQGRLSDIEVQCSELRAENERLKEENVWLKRKVVAFMEITVFLVSSFRTCWVRLSSRDFYGRLYGEVDGCKLCFAEAVKDEQGVKRYTHKNDCALVVLDYVAEGQEITVDW